MSSGPAVLTCRAGPLGVLAQGLATRLHSAEASHLTFRGKPGGVSLQKRGAGRELAGSGRDGSNKQHAAPRCDLLCSAAMRGAASSCAVQRGASLRTVLGHAVALGCAALCSPQAGAAATGTPTRPGPRGATPTTSVRPPARAARSRRRRRRRCRRVRRCCRPVRPRGPAGNTHTHTHTHMKTRQECVPRKQCTAPSKCVRWGCTPKGRGVFRRGRGRACSAARRASGSSCCSRCRWFARRSERRPPARRRAHAASFRQNRAACGRALQGRGLCKERGRAGRQGGLQVAVRARQIIVRTAC